MNKFYVYQYTDPRNDEPFYIGKGKDMRDYEHILDVKNENYVEKHNFQKYDRIKDILKSGQEPIITKLLEDLEEWLSFCIEKYYIKEIGRRDLGLGPLLNLTDGGEGGSGYKMTDKQKKKLSEKAKESYRNGRINPFKGKKHTEERKKKQSEIAKNQYRNGRVHPLLGIGHTAESKEKMRQTKLAKGYTEADRQGHIKRNSTMIDRKLTVRIAQFDLNNNQIAEFNSIHEAARETEIHHATIKKASQKENICHGKYVFKRLNVWNGEVSGQQVQN
jgi:group I intron endonuclease